MGAELDPPRDAVTVEDATRDTTPDIIRGVCQYTTIPHDSIPHAVTAFPPIVTIGVVTPHRRATVVPIGVAKRLQRDACVSGALESSAMCASA